MSLDFPSSPSNGDVFNGFVYNSTLGVWDVATSSGKFTVTASGSTAYVFNGSGTISDSNPTLFLTRGQTYDFEVDATGHPFYIKTVSGTGTSNAYSDGVTNNGIESGTVTFTVQMDAPDTLYYNCSVHSAMAGTIYVLDSTLGLSDFSVTTNSAGTAALTYSNSTGVFTYTPPDLSGYLTSYTETDPVFVASAAYGITSTNITNWNTAYGWGDHSTAGYLTSYTETNDLTASVTWANVPDANITQSSVTQHQAALSITESQISDLGAYLTGISGEAIGALSDVTITSASSGEVLKYNGTAWVNSVDSTYTDSAVDTHLNTSTAATNEVLSWNGTDYDWVAQSGGGGGASVTTADTAPSSPSDGDLWYDTTTLRLYVYYDDGSSSQWVKANPSGSGIALTSLSVTTNSAGTAALSYSDTTGVFSYTPPDLSSYLTSYTVTESDVTTHQAALSITESQISTTVYSLTGTAIDPANGGIQTKTISANTTFTETLASGESVVLMLEGAASYTITWPTITWVTSSGNSAPTLTAKDTLVLWKVSTTLYGAYVGSYA